MTIMQRKDGTWSGGLLALIILALAAGCGGGSSSSDDTSGDSSDGGSTPPDDSGSTPVAMSDEEAAAVATGMARGFDSWEGMIAEWENPDEVRAPLGVQGAELALGTNESADNLLDTLEMATQESWNAACQTGSMSVTETPSGHEAVYNECTIDSPMSSMYIDGKVTYFQSDLVRTDYSLSSSVTYEAYTLEMSSTAGSNLSMSMDGTIAVHTDSALPGRGLVELDLTMGTSGDCDGTTRDSVWELDYSLQAEPQGGDLFGIEINGSMTGMGVTTNVETLEPVQINQGADYPHGGKVRVTYGGQPVSVEYVQDGLYVDMTPYNWSDFEDQYMEEELDENACLP
ncbi:MAG: hypothetical protein ACQETK_08435 [Pseudomonadota bacterium]